MTARPIAFSKDGDLTGLWSGEFWYRGVSFPTPFTAHFIDSDGDLSGTTLEPNTFAAPDLADLSGELSGSRGALSLRFTKIYHPNPGVHSLPIFYDGAVDPNFTLIDGEWNFGVDGALSGRFVLVRVSRGIAVPARTGQQTVARQ